MFMRSRLSEEDGEGRHKEDFPVVEQSSLSKYCGPGVEQQCPFPCSCQYSRHSERDASPAKASPNPCKHMGEGTGSLSQWNLQW